MSDSVSDEEEASTPAPATDKKPEREGLPKEYRMRADAHYVEQLTSKRVERAPVDLPRAKDAEGHEREVRTDLRDRRDPRDRRAERVLAQVSEDLATIGSATALAASQTSPLAQRVSVDVIRAHTWRAAWLLRAQAILDGTHRRQSRSCQLGTLLGQVRDGFGAEGRLTGIGLHLHASDWNATVLVDEPALLAALTGAIIATIGLVGQGRPGERDAVTVTLTAAAGAGELRAVEVTQDAVAVDASVGHRFFDQSWTDRPGGWLAAVGAATAREVAQQHGGTGAFLIRDQHGSMVRLNLTNS